ncbi:putative membrane protein [Tamaricihabitans halophyticus]|uniref:Putative membrane protein n=1 Tax=Tamaricihabitans halophyticus TaxID=1262583 RepID=A0A4V2SRF9_9PSEU|nr:DUF2254 family protein [Tamaricihabitans halophyticus]TCP42646.1 putative membrane protein [Tamaricihabitans halophyticus]
MIQKHRSPQALPMRPRQRARVTHALQEFLFLPTLVAAGCLVIGVGTVILDRGAGSWGHTARESFAALAPPEAASSFVSTVTPGLLTVISIIFFVLLMAVQHQSSTYSPAVLDQFLRRKTNQVFFGLFVGLTTCSLLSLGLLPQGKAVVSGTAVAAMTIVTLFSLLVFAYSTVDQMRPSATVWMLEKLAVDARASQQPLLARCRSEPLRTDLPAREVRSECVGYVVGIDHGLLATAIQPVRHAVEIELHAGMGEHVVPGTVVATVRAESATERDWFADTVLSSLRLGRMRDVDHDAAHVVDQLSSIAWAATAVSGDPEGARIAVEALHSLLVSFARDDERHSAGIHGGPLPLVYNERMNGRIVDGLTSVIAASGQSGQHQTCSAVLLVLARAMPHLPEPAQHLVADRLQRVLYTSLGQVYTYQMEQAFEAIHGAMRAAGRPDNAQRVRELEAELFENRRLATPRTPPY